MTAIFDGSTVGNSEFSAYNDDKFTKIINEQLENVNSGEEFYSKLHSLRNEQKQTLLFMQEIYDQKQVLKQEIEKSEGTLNSLKNIDLPTNQNDYKYRLNTVSAYEKNLPKYEMNTVNLGQNDSYSAQSKPPVAPTRNSVHFEKCHAQQLKKDDHNKLMESLDDGIRKIETMWDNFSLNDNANLKSIEFNERFEKKLKRPVSRKKQPMQVEWQPRVTIPQPFSMSIRDQMKQDKKKVNAINEMREEREKRLEAEARECQKKFKARPVPAHVKLPLYEQRRLYQDLKKSQLREMRREYANCMEESKTMNRSASELRKSDNKKVQFNAQPLPEFYFNPNADDEIKEQELYKQISRQMRALELLKESKLPNNMGLLEEKKLLEIERNQLFMSEMEKLHKEMNDKELTRASMRKSHDVPDFDESYKKFTIELEQRKAFNRKSIKPKPFQLRSASRTGCRKACAHNESNASLNRSSSSMSRLNRSLSASMDALPIKSTEAQILRESSTKGKLNNIMKKEMQKEHIDKMKSIRMKKLQEQIKEKSNYTPNEVERNIERKTRKLKLDERKQEEEYEQYIADINKKIELRKLQIEQVEEVNKRKALEKHYNEVFRKNGIEDFENYESEQIHMAKPVGIGAAGDDWINE